jgi:hypothetical protein
MTTTPDVRSNTALAIREKQTEFDTTQIAALATLGLGRHVTPDDLRVYFHQIRRTGLDPFLKQIYMIERMVYNPDTKQREPRQTIQTGIDGFRLVVRRGADKLGVKLRHEGPFWCGPDGVWREIWPDPDNPPFAAKYTILLDGEPFPAIAHFSEFVATRDEYEPDREENGQKIKGRKTGRKIPAGQWVPPADGGMPAHMLAKCAEAGASRKAFPQDLSGIYLNEEMQRGEPEQIVAIPTEPGAGPVVDAEPMRDWIAEVNAANTPAELNRIWAQCKNAGERTAEFNDRLAARSVEIMAQQRETEEEGEAKAEEDDLFAEADAEAAADLAAREEDSDAGAADPA